MKKAFNEPIEKHLLNVVKYWLGGFVSLMLLFYLIISFK